jgi:hypothetical protein
VAEHANRDSVTPAINTSEMDLATPAKFSLLIFMTFSRE